MFAPTRYLAWARRYYGQVRFDLATSGIPTIPLAELGMPAAAELDDPSGWTRLRDAIATYNGVPPGEAVATLGTSHALWLVYASLASAGDDVLVEEPAYEPLLRAAEGAGARVVRFARASADQFALDPERISRAMTPRTRAVVVSNLHNPSGVRASDESLIAAARIAQARGAYLVVDEVYAPFDELVDDRGTFTRSARKLAPNVIAVSSLTKCFGLSPHRIGWVLAPPEIVTRLDDAITGSCGHLPLPHAHFALRAFSCIGQLAARSRGLLAGKRARVAAWVASQGLVWSAPMEGLFGFACVPGGPDLTPAIEAAAREREVLVAAGSFFGVPNGFRLAWSAPGNLLDEGLARLAETLGAAIGR
jgi:aspartate/methionine/tyrosine aminotransferase